MIGCVVVSSTLSGSAFGIGSSCLHHMRVCGRPFAINPPVKMKYCLFRSIQKKSPNTVFVLSTYLVNNPLISPRFWNSMLDRYNIGNYRVDVLITPMKQSPRFHDSSAAGTYAKYESAQTILSVLAHGITNFFCNFLP